MAQLTIQRPTLTGTAVTYAAAASGGDEFANDGRIRLHVRNGAGMSIDVTVDSPGTCNHGGTHDLTISVDAAAEKVIGPFHPDRFNDQDGNVNVTYSSETSVTVAAIA